MGRRVLLSRTSLAASARTAGNCWPGTPAHLGVDEKDRHADHRLQFHAISIPRTPYKAYEVFASQTDGLLAILVFQYSPYEAGAGKVFWVKDRSGIEVPVITARYSIWEHANNRERAGTPAKVAREIRQTVEKTASAQLPRCDWVITHVWSYFKQAPGADENAEDMPQENAAVEGGIRGYSPVIWCAERLPASVRVVSPEELVWRIRMKHDPSQTRKLITQFQ